MSIYSRRRGIAKEIAVRLPKTREGGIIIMATDSNKIAKCIIATPSQRKELVEHMLTDENIQSDILEIMSEYDSE